MKRILSVIALCLLIAVCPGKPDIPMTCQDVPELICSDGSSPEACVATDLSVCGMDVMGRWYQCRSCDFDAGGCTRAITRGLNACGYDDGGLLMEEENPEFDYMVDEMQAQMEELKVLVY